MMGKAQGSDLCFFAFLIKLLSHVKHVRLQRAGLGTTSENHPVFLPSFWMHDCPKPVCTIAQIQHKGQKVSIP